MRRKRKLARERQRRWRDRNPITYLFRNHVNNATRRRKVVLWDLEEFIEWCTFTGHHVNAKDGYEIHRFGDTGPYCAANCMTRVCTAIRSICPPGGGAHDSHAARWTR